MDGPSKENPDYYQILGVACTATPEEIETAFRELARRWHPDVCGDVEHASKNFKRIVEAHEVLRDPDKRRQYDRQRAGSRGGSSRTPRRYAKESRPTFGIRPIPRRAGPPEDFFDLIRAFFDGAAGTEAVTPEVRRDSPLEVELPVSPEEAQYGGAVTITLTLPGRCRACEGSGRVEKTPCNRCGGRGSIPRERCSLVMHVPPGVWTGTRLRTVVESTPESGVFEWVVFRIRVSPYA